MAGFGDINGPCDGWVTRAGDCVLIQDNDSNLFFFRHQVEQPFVARIDGDDWEALSVDKEHFRRIKGYEDKEPFGNAPYIVQVLK